MKTSILSFVALAATLAAATPLAQPEPGTGLSFAKRHGGDATSGPGGNVDGGHVIAHSGGGDQSNDDSNFGGDGGDTESGEAVAGNGSDGGGNAVSGPGGDGTGGSASVDSDGGSQTNEDSNDGGFGGDSTSGDATGGNGR